MNIFDLAFKYDIKIIYDGDYDGVIYELKLKYDTCLSTGEGQTDITICLKQSDIDDMYAGVMKLAKELQNHITPDY